MKILGIHSGVTLGQHDAGAALILDGKLVSVIEEERLVRIKSPRGYLPTRSIAQCLKDTGLTIDDIDLLAHPGETYEDMPARIRSYMIRSFGGCPEVMMINHQMAHLASAFYCSEFSDALCVSWDAYGDSLSAAFAIADREKGLEVIRTVDNKSSLGNFYATMTSYIGFDPGEDEFKVMGLSPYGKNRFDLSGFAAPTDDGYVVDDSYMRQDPPLRSRFEPFFSEKLINTLGIPPRRFDQPIEQAHMDIAYSTQMTLEECAVSMIDVLHKTTGLRRLCLAGGVSLNCTMNNVLRQMSCIDDLFVQPAASDRGLPLGSALHAAASSGEPVNGLDHAFLGPKRGDDEIENALMLTGQKFKKIADPPVYAAEKIADGKIIGWYQGRSEFGPRALGNRSILANPTLPNMKDEINRRIKFREEFRPFAPAVIEERAFEIFDISSPSPFMTIACMVHDGWRERLPATTHINGSARVQTVHATSNPLFHQLIEHFGQLSGVPVVLNTSFNVRGQPIVETPIDAIGTFAATGLDELIIGDYAVVK